MWGCRFGARLRNPAFPVRNRFRARLGVGAWASDGNFNSRKAHGNLGNLFSVGQPVYYVQLNGILDVLDGFFLGIALAVAALERGAGNEKAIGVRFDDDRKSNVLHDLGHYRSVLEPGKPEFVEGCETGRAGDAADWNTHRVGLRCALQGPSSF